MQYGVYTNRMQTFKKRQTRCYSKTKNSFCKLNQWSFCWHIHKQKVQYRQGCSYCSIGIATNSIGDTFWVLVQVSVIHFVCSIDMDIGDTFSLISSQYSIPIFLPSGALVKSVNNNITVPESVKASTVVLSLKYILLQCLLINIMSL